MAERVTARDRLERILHILPAAAREGGVRLAEVADALGTSERQVLRDVTEVIAREYYHPAGSAEGLQITLERDRVAVRTAGDFDRPVRLSPREALALGLALRARAMEATGGRRDALLDLAARLERGLATRSPDEFLPRFALGGGLGSGDGLRTLFRTAVEQRRRCRIRYVKPGDAQPTDRVICPYSLVFAEGTWYVIGHCTLADGVRAFRLDRVLEAEPVDETFDVPDDFDPADWIATGGRLYSADDDVEVAVRYSLRVARWLAEREEYEEAGGGAIIVRRRVADPHWLVRHVLQYGADAEVLEPEEMREAVGRAVRGIIA